MRNKEADVEHVLYVGLYPDLSDKELIEKYAHLNQINNEQLEYLENKLSLLKKSIKYVGEFGYPIQQRIDAVKRHLESNSIGIDCANVVLNLASICDHEPRLPYEISCLRKYISRMEEIQKELNSILHTLKRHQHERLEKQGKTRKYLIGTILILVVILLKLKGVIT